MGTKGKHVKVAVRHVRRILTSHNTVLTLIFSVKAVCPVSHRRLNTSTLISSLKIDSLCDFEAKLRHVLGEDAIVLAVRFCSFHALWTAGREELGTTARMCVESEGAEGHVEGVGDVHRARHCVRWLLALRQSFMLRRSFVVGRSRSQHGKHGPLCSFFSSFLSLSLCYEL